MNLVLYQNGSGRNVLNKNLTQISGGITGTIKDESDVVNPSIILSKDVINLYDFNYFYLSDFNRYYYVTEKTVEHGRTIIHGHVDVLMSFNTEIKNLNVIASRVSNKNYVDFYQVDSEISFKNYNNIKTKAFPNGFEESNQFILVASGG